MAQSHELAGELPLGVSLSETPAGIRVLRSAQSHELVDVHKQQCQTGMGVL